MSRIIIRSSLILFFGLLFLYLTGIVVYINFYYPKTYIGDMNIGDMSYNEVVDYVDAYYDDYTITIHGREDYVYHPHIVYDKNTVHNIMLKQQSYFWIFKFNQRYDISLDYMVDKEQTYQELKELLFQDQQPSKDAELVKTENGFEIKPEIYGNTYINNDAVLADIYLKIILLHTETDITCYLEEPEIKADDQQLNELCNKANNIVNGEYYYQLGKNKETLSSSDINISVEGGELKVNYEPLGDFIESLAGKYNTVDNKRQFTTTNGDEITLEAGDYGWRVNEADSEKALAENILNGVTGEQSLVYSQEAASHDGADYGNNYVEISTSEQHLWFYKNGECIMDSDVVTGTPPNSSTPPGVYKLKYKQEDATLKGEGYETKVNYWMPFNNNVGMHDATWRGGFGGNIYQSNGSHGCVNMPLEKAKELYNSIDVNTAVIVY